MHNENVLTVKQLNFYVKTLIEGDLRLNSVAITGEISNFKNHYSSGHLYFTLKDNDASIRCVMFKGYAQYVKFDISDGMQVILKGRVSIYEKDGQYQFYAEEMHEAGLGDITLRFNQIKEKLQREGLFDTASKREIPKFPRSIAVVTSQTGAAIRDILNILSRRWPLAQVILCPVSVQGENAVPEMCQTLDKLYSLSVADVIIIGRGGGSVEDLWAFNEEKLARKVYESPVPVISAVGHETDFTICDFVADLRAPTPSAAAELCVPDANEILALLSRYETYLKSFLNGKLNLSRAKLEKICESSFFKNPQDIFISRRLETLDLCLDKLRECQNKIISDRNNKFEQYVLQLDSLSPLKTLSRGFTHVSKNKTAVTSVDQLNVGDDLELKFSDGTANCKLLNITKD